MNNHGHTEMSNFRNKDCIIRTADYVDKAIEYGMNGCSITDHEALTGHVQFLQRYLFLKKLREITNRRIGVIELSETLDIDIVTDIFIRINFIIIIFINSFFFI